MSIRSHHGRRPSLSTTHAPPIRISHSKSSSTVGHIKHGNLGSGVTIVRTPQEALAGSGVSVECASDQEIEHGEEEDSDPLAEDEDPQENEGEELEEDGGETHEVRVEQAETPSVPPAYSPPRASLPLSKSTPTLPLKDAHPTRPSRPPPPPPSAPDATVLSQKKLPPPPLSSLFPPVAPVPAHLSTPSTPPPFACILLSSVPPNAIDFSKVLVTLETCTATHRTTLNTLISRPSHLASYLKSLFADAYDELDVADNTSLYSRAESGSFNSIFHNHLTSSGLLAPSSVQCNPARLEALLALRDEAAYLDLPELVQLCITELRRSSNGHPPQHSRAPSHVLAHTRGPSNGSVRSMDTLREYDEHDCRHGEHQQHSLGSIRGRGLGHANGPAATKEKEEQPHPAPIALLHRRLASQSRERPELVEVKPASLRGRSTGNWL
ncbi:hypothetical protein EDB92DRAFT_1832534 [Lactarius akahatsu]|uniref:Uncharacterized protein n=1 Tax=Lactarius akahatsu TaxID=416441 RepID=A0AAD4QBV3_9AGAM|nr:hypothetical protein EDB92DRAFT_1832534 [Lactarius akahatsu]